MKMSEAHKEVYIRSISLIVRHLIHVMYSTTKQQKEVSLSSQKLLEYLSSVTDGPLEAIPKTERVLISAILVGYAKSFYDQTYSYVKKQPIYFEDFNIEFNSKDTYDLIKSVKTLKNCFSDRIQFSESLEKLRDVGFILKYKAFSHVESLGRTTMILLSSNFVKDFYSKYYLSHMVVDYTPVDVVQYVRNNISKITEQQSIIDFAYQDKISEFIEFCSKYKNEWDRQGIAFFKAVTIALLCTDPKIVCDYVKNNCYQYLHLLGDV